MTGMQINKPQPLNYAAWPSRKHRIRPLYLWIVFGMIVVLSSLMIVGRLRAVRAEHAARAALQAQRAAGRTAGALQTTAPSAGRK